jgi:NAD(P)-dependent dehydrogenase (short-subunit alcohol dehydrogenase family)
MNLAPPGKALAGRTALVSGAAQGIGRAIAERFLQAGAAVIVLDRDVSAGECTAAELSRDHDQPPVSFVAADLLVDAQVEHAMKEIGARFGKLDVLVNNAGIEIEKSFAALAVGDWDRIMGVNLRGAFLLTRAALPLFPASGGAIVNISSIHATHAFADSLPYACSKAGLIALTRNLALELAPRHIRVNAICPGYVDTRIWDEYLRHASDPAALAASTAALHPLGRRGLPADIAESALFLAADSAAFVTGTSLVVDGGLTIRAHP